MTGNTLDKYSQCSIQQEGTRLTLERKVSPLANEERFHTFQTSRVDREPSSPFKVASRALSWKVPRSNRSRRRHGFQGEGNISRQGTYHINSFIMI